MEQMKTVNNWLDAQEKLVNEISMSKNTFFFTFYEHNSY